MELIECPEETIGQVIGAAISVHRHFGPGLLETVYELALCAELSHRGITATRQLQIPVHYKGELLGTGFRADMLVEGCLLLEIKSMERIHPIHLAQMLSYQRLTCIRRGLILNFGEALLRDGIKRVSL